MNYYDAERFFYGNVAAQIIVIILIIAIWVGLFFLFRAITLWYLKINKMLKELQKSNEYLMRITMAVEQGNRMPPAGGGFGPGSLMPGPGPAMPGNNPAMPGANSVMPGNNPAMPVTPVMPGATPVMSGEPFAAETPWGTEAEKKNPETAQLPKQNICKQCGAVLQDGALFCVQCGTKN